MTGRSWWKNSSNEQKTKQIEGGFECGMSTSQIAKNLGVRFNDIHAFATRRDITIPVVVSKKLADARRANGIIYAQTVSRRKGIPEISSTVAFSIFGQRDNPDNFDFGGMEAAD